MPDSHWQIREIDRSLALVGGPAAAYTHGAEWGQINTPAPIYSTKVCFMAVGSMSTKAIVNERSISLDVYADSSYLLLE